MSFFPINTFSYHYRRKYGGAVGKIPLDTGVECPNRAQGGCIFCRARSFTPLYLDKKDTIPVQLARGKAMLSGRKFRFLLGYFQQETTTALEFNTLRQSIVAVLDDSDCVGIVISTRPDYVEERLVDFLDDLCRERGKECLLELGLQSVHSESLQYLNRNHSYEDFLNSVQLIKRKEHLQAGAHLILGIPGEEEHHMLESVQSVCGLGINAIKFHHLQVIQSTPLHKIHQQKEIKVFTVEGYLQLLARLLCHVPRKVVIHRLWSSSHPDILVAPRWDLHAHELSVRLNEIMIAENLYQGKFSQ